MALDTLFTNGVIAVKEKALLGEKILRFPEMTVQEVLRALSESNFGGGADPRDTNALLENEERALDTFIRTYAPTEADKAYFLLPRDFHNLKALYKATLLSLEPEPMLAPEGLHTVAELREMLENGNPLLPEIEEGATGAEIGAAFDRAMFEELFRVCRGRRILKKLLSVRVDLLNLLTAFRAADETEAEGLYLKGGTLRTEDIFALTASEQTVGGKEIVQVLTAAREARGKGLPFTEAERIAETFEEEYFFERRFALCDKEPFLYYVLRRRSEIRNIRTILVCLNAGVEAKEIKKRLVGVQ